MALYKNNIADFLDPVSSASQNLSGSWSWYLILKLEINGDIAVNTQNLPN